MDKKKNEAKKSRERQRRLGSTLLFFVASIGMFWWAYALFTASNCEFSGVKLALVIFPICTVIGNEAAAIIPFSFGCLSAWLVWKLIMGNGNLTLRSSGTTQKRAAP